MKAVNDVCKFSPLSNAKSTYRNRNFSPIFRQNQKRARSRTYEWKLFHCREKCKEYSPFSKFYDQLPARWTSVALHSVYSGSTIRNPFFLYFLLELPFINLASVSLCRLPSWENEWGKVGNERGLNLISWRHSTGIIFRINYAIPQALTGQATWLPNCRIFIGWFLSKHWNFWLRLP